MVPAKPSVRPCDIEPINPYVQVEVGIPSGRSLSGFISYDHPIEGSRLVRCEHRHSTRQECRQITELAGRIFTEFRNDMAQIRILHISYTGVPSANIQRIQSILWNALLNISRSMQEEEDEFRPSTPPPMSDPGIRDEVRVHGVITTPPKPLLMRYRGDYQYLENVDLPSRRSVPEGAETTQALPPGYDNLPPGYQFATPPRPVHLRPAEEAIVVPPQLGGIEHDASTFRGPLFDDSDGPGALPPAYSTVN